jgi:hypothetical protein
VTFSFDGLNCTTVALQDNETLALLHFATERIGALLPSTDVTFCCLPNKLRNPFDLGWIEKWIKDGFRKKPDEHRMEWRAFYKFYSDRKVDVAFEDLPPKIEKILLQSYRDHLRGGPESGPAPGDAFEDPWAKKDGPNDWFDRAMSKNRDK